MTFRRRITGLGAAVLLVGIMVGLPATLLKLGGNLLPNQLPSLSDLSEALTSPDDGTLAVAAITLLGWAAWLILAGAIVVEATSRLRGITTPALPGLRLPQLAARNLVTAALLLFTAAPLLVQHAGEAAAEPVVSPGDTQRPADTQHHPTDAGTSLASGNRGEVEPSTVPYRVRSGDSLWTIARDHLGSATRYPEIAKLNAKVLGGRPGFITPGTILQLPTSAPIERDRRGQTVIVKRGDTLSGIAEDQLGDADRYPEIFKGSKAIAQPGNRHLTDPDVIDVGWTLKIPGPTTRKDTGKQPNPRTDNRGAKKDQPRSPEDRLTQEPTAKTSATATPTTGATPTRRPTEPATHWPTSSSSAEAADDPSRPDTHAARWLLTGLTGGGVVLSASLLLLLRTRRRSQFRNRRPGRTIAVAEPQLTPVEKTISAVGDFSVPSITFLDAALRRLAASQTAAECAMPRVTAVQLSSTAIRLYLSRPFDLPAPWQNSDDRCCWMLPLNIELDRLGPDVADQPAPYPLLVTVGPDDHNQVWLFNWEELGVVNITGDPTYKADFARYLAAELACNPWSDAVTLDCAGVAGEIAALNPDRVRIHPAGTDPAAVLIAEALATLGRGDEAERGVATARACQAGAESWPARLLLIDATDPPPASLDQLIGIVHEHHGRTGTAVAIIGQLTKPGGVVVELTNNGRLRVPSMGLDLVAVGLTGDEALGCAALLAQSTSDTPDVPIPHRKDADGWHAYADEAGALRTEHTRPRGTPPGPAAEPTTSILPRDDDDYLRAAAATADDLAALAPQVPGGLRNAVETADPTLDADINRWFAKDCELPRLTLLGPVGARTHGTAIAKRRPYYTELLAYLATRPHGATPEEVADAFSITGPRVRNDIKVLRDWLGVNPCTGRKHLPDARDSAAARARGIGVYQVEDLLVDADLFRRLRVRGESRGADGIEDLRRALQLVTGQPFDKLRPGGWTWLYEGDRLDHHLVCGVVDVAHLVTTHALAEGDLTTARTATQIATSAAPYEEIPRLDLAAIAAASGHRQEAARIVRDEVCNRSDDGHPPLELSERTEQILAGHDWLPPMKSAS
jgi:nucleoid-associated protein YgaU